MDFSSISDITKNGFGGFVTISELQKSKCSDVPTERGVYFILKSSTDASKFLTKSVGGHFNVRIVQLKAYTPKKRQK